jgi:diguanylate cyclase (GGDEF)-like protein
MSPHDYHVLCFLDLDNFKIINDENGHAAGDELLRQITGILRDNIRSRDTLARIGGDEFVVLMEHCQLNVAVKIAEKIQKIIAEYEFNWRAQTFSIGISIGVTRLQNDKTVELVLSTADAACYKAKKSGRSCIHVDESM